MDDPFDIDRPLATFVPTRRQLAVRMMMHRSLAPQTIMKLTPANLSTVLTSALGESVVNDLMAWCHQDPGFLYWISEPDEAEFALNAARVKAAKVITNLVDQDISSDPKMATLQYNAAKDLLGMTQPPPPQVVRNTVNLRAAAANVPKSLANKSTEELESQLRQLKGE